MSPEQQQWLRTTRVRVRHLTFHINDAASEALIDDQLTLVSVPGGRVSFELGSALG